VEAARRKEIPVEPAHAPSLQHRVKDHFARQIAWFEELLRDLDRLDEDLDAPDASDRIEGRLHHVKPTAALEREFAALARDWREAEGLAERDRAEVRALAKRARALAEQVCAAYDRGLDRVAAKSSCVQGSLGELRRGREVVGRYRGSTGLDAAFFDKRA